MKTLEKLMLVNQARTKAQNSYQGKTNDAYQMLQKTHESIIENYMQKQMLAKLETQIHRMIDKKLKQMDIDVSIDGEKLTNAIIKKITDKM